MNDLWDLYPISVCWMAVMVVASFVTWLWGLI